MLRSSFVISVVVSVAASRPIVSNKFYICNTGICELLPAHSLLTDGVMSQGTCLAICGQGSLWPYPNGFVDIQEKYAVVNFDSSLSKFVWKDSGESVEQSDRMKTNSVLATSMNVFNGIVNDMKKSQPKQGKASSTPERFVVQFDITDLTVTSIDLDVDEGYSLVIRSSSGSSSGGDESSAGNVTAVISAQTVFGARHGLETLSQLMAWEPLHQAHTVASHVDILGDRPQFRYRGLMLDLSRNYLTIDKIKTNIRALVREVDMSSCSLALIQCLCLVIDR